MMQPDPAAALKRLKDFLYLCQPRMLDGVTVDELMARYGTDRRVTEYERTIARQKRSGGAA